MKVLSIDAGINAAIHARQLRFLEEQRPGFLARADVLVGTSDSAFVALHLAARPGRGHAEDLRAIDDAIALFDDVLRLFRVTPRLAARFLAGRGPRSLSASLERLLRERLGDETLGGLARRGRKVIIVCLDAVRWARETLCSFDPIGRQGEERTLVDAALSSSAFPVILAPHVSPFDGRAYLDGALVAANPALAGLEETAGYVERNSPGEAGPRGSAERNGTDALGGITLLSLGVEGGPAPGGRFGRLPALLRSPIELPDRLLLGSVNLVDVQCRSVLGPRYRRIRHGMALAEAFAQVFVAPERLIRRLADEAAGRCRPSEEDLAWIDRAWLA